MDTQTTEFLIRAKRATYAGHGGSRYEEGGLLYIDNYIGGERFAGEEALWRDGKPFWAMNYAGRVIGEGFSGDFLKEALYNPPVDKPFRGAEEYINGEYRYACRVEGAAEWFSGHEEIFFKGNKVYECNFHGGAVS